MDLKRLALLVQVANFDSFSKAATVLGVAQPALGRQMQKLEEECGFRIFYRHGRGVFLTSEGQALLERAAPLLRELSNLPAQLQSAVEEPKGLVTVGLTPAVCKLIGVPLLTALKAKYPELRVNLVAAYSGYVHEWLMGGRVDVAILHDARRSSAIHFRSLCRAELFLISAVGTATQKVHQRISLAQVATLPLILPSGNHGLRRTLDEAASKAGTEMNIMFESDTLELLKDVVLKGLAHSLLAKTAVIAELEQGLLTAQSITSPELFTKLVLATASSRPITTAIRVVEAEIRKIIEYRVEADGERLGLTADE